MAMVQWIKVDVNWYKDERLRLIRRREKGQRLAEYIWLMLMMVAGRSNAGGALMLAEGVPYDSAMLADELEVTRETMERALRYFLELRLLVRDGEVLFINEWELMQSEDKLTILREYARERMRNYRQRKKEEAAVNERDD